VQYLAIGTEYRVGRTRLEVVLRDVTDADLSVFFDHQQDPVATRMAAFPSRDREAFMAHWAKILADPAVIVQTIEAEGQVAGNVVSFDADARREVGYWLGREYWGSGIATRALTEFLSHDTTRPLFAGVARNNAGSVRVLEKCGFAHAGEDGAMLTFRLG
jgi:RimJ/RimL family protein N-acetyltransferase